MGKGYVYAELEVTDPTLFEEYRAKVAPNVAEFGGRFLTRGATPTVLEGDRRPRRTVLLEFESLDQAKTWYHSEKYQELVRLREKSAHTDLSIFEGA